MRADRPFILLTIAVVFDLLLPSLCMDGMFLDGVTYATIAKNLSLDIGSFWKPHYTQTLYPDFHEHPPFAFIFQSYFFDIFGTGWYTERLYCLLIALLSILAIFKIWRLFVAESNPDTTDWLPILIWMSIPIVSWSLKNNILENTMTLATLVAVYFSIKAMILRKWIWLILASLMILIAFGTKGAVGLFPLAVPMLYAVVYGNHKDGVIASIMLLFGTVLIATLLAFLMPELVECIHLYLDKQLLPALEDKREITTSNRFSILAKLILEMALLILILLFCSIKGWLKTKSLPKVNKTTLLFFLIAISASLPLIISLKQRKFYLVPSIPFYALSAAYFLKEYIDKGKANLSVSFKKYISYFALLSMLLITLYSAYRFGDYARDREKLEDVYRLAEQMEQGTILSTSYEMYPDWGLAAYLARYAYISLDYENMDKPFLLLPKEYPITSLLDNYRVVDIELNKYLLLQKKE